MASQNISSVNLGLSVLPEIDQSDYPKIYYEFLKVETALRTLLRALDSYTGTISEDPQYWDRVAPQTSVKLQNLSKVYLQAGEAITEGAIVSILDGGGGTTKAYHAQGVNGLYPTRAICTTPGGVALGSWGEFMLMGITTSYSGLLSGTLLQGTLVYMSAAAAGEVTQTPPSAVGNLVQCVGFALSPTHLFFNPELVGKQL